MDRDVITLRLPPSINHMYANVYIKGRSVKVLTKSAKEWMEEATNLLNAWKIKKEWKTVDKKIIVYLWYYFPDNRKRDTHNSLKILMDALEKSEIYSNDRYGLPRIMDYQIDRRNPRVEIMLDKF